MARGEVLLSLIRKVGGRPMAGIQGMRRRLSRACFKPIEISGEYGTATVELRLRAYILQHLLR